MYPNANIILRSIAGAAVGIAMVASAQAPAAAPAAPAPAAAPAAPTWSVGPMDISGFVDGYYSYNANRPAADSLTGQTNQLYNFNDQADTFSLSAAKLTLNHDPDPIGAHLDLLFGRTNTLVNGGGGDTNYIEQAFVSLKPTKAKGFEADFGKFVTSAGAEVIEAKDDWNYSRSILFAWAIPYYHFGLRTSMPVSKSETLGVQVVNGWNNVSANNGGVTIGATSAFVKPKASWFLNYYGGPSNYNTQHGYRNLIDTTLLLTPGAKFNMYINYDYGQHRDGIAKSSVFPFTFGDKNLYHWQGVAFAAKSQVSSTSAIVGRYEYFKDMNGFSTGTQQTLQEFTGTYEYKWVEGLLMRLEYRRDWSDTAFFTKGNLDGAVKAQSTVTAGFIAFFGPKR